MALAFVLCSLTSLASAQDDRENRVVYLDQGWSQQERMAYYYTSQGSAILPYEVFLHLEEADSERLFRSEEVSGATGCCPASLIRSGIPMVCLSE